MTLLTGYDAAYPPPVPPATDFVAFYIGGDTPHPWTVGEIQAQHARYRLPIYVRTGTGAARAAVDARECLNAILRRGIPSGVLIAIDMETAADPEYVAEFERMMAQAGHPVITYGSKNTVFGNHARLYWVADWTSSAHQVPGASITQWKNLPLYDLNVAEPGLPLWDARPPAPKPTKPPEMPAEDSIQVTNVDDNGFDLKWPPVDTATMYRVRVTYQGKTMINTAVQAPAFGVMGLDPDHTYTVHVAAGNPVGWSAETGGPQVRTTR